MLHRPKSPREIILLIPVVHQGKQTLYVNHMSSCDPYAFSVTDGRVFCVQERQPWDTLGVRVIVCVLS